MLIVVARFLDDFLLGFPVRGVFWEIADAFLTILNLH
jgi:hypothetical protein